EKANSPVSDGSASGPATYVTGTTTRASFTSISAFVSSVLLGRAPPPSNLSRYGYSRLFLNGALGCSTNCPLSCPAGAPGSEGSALGCQRREKVSASITLVASTSGCGEAVSGVATGAGR